MKRSGLRGPLILFKERNMEFKHEPIMLNECIENLKIKQDGVYVDGTLGRGGHSSQILSKLDNGHLYCFDQDMQAIDETPKSNNIPSTFSTPNFDNSSLMYSKFECIVVKLLLIDFNLSVVPRICR